jgi:hypothetical protein
MAPQKRTPFHPRKSRWLRPSDLPFSRGHVYRLILEGILFSVELRVPGSSRSVRVIDGESLDRYLLKLGREQQAARLNKREAAPV